MRVAQPHISCRGGGWAVPDSDRMVRSKRFWQRLINLRLAAGIKARKQLGGARVPFQ